MRLLNFSLLLFLCCLARKSTIHPEGSVQIPGGENRILNPVMSLVVTVALASRLKTVFAASYLGLQLNPKVLLRCLKSPGPDGGCQVLGW